jgi:hypothetical protein
MRINPRESCSWLGVWSYELLGILALYFLLSTFYFLLSTFYFLLSTFYFLLSTFYFLLSTFYFLLSTFYFLLSTLCCLFATSRSGEITSTASSRSFALQSIIISIRLLLASRIGIFLRAFARSPAQIFRNRDYARGSVLCLDMLGMFTEVIDKAGTLGASSSNSHLRRILSPFHRSTSKCRSGIPYAVSISLEGIFDFKPQSRLSKRTARVSQTSIAFL